MKRLAMIGALLGALIFGATSTSQAQVIYRRPVGRVAARAVLAPYGPRVWGPRAYGPRYYPRYYGPAYYGYRGWGPGWYGPGVGVGFGMF